MANVMFVAEQFILTFFHEVVVCVGFTGVHYYCEMLVFKETGTARIRKPIMLS